MGTNYYLRNKVSEEYKKLLKNYIDEDKNDTIKEIVSKLYSYPGTYNDGELGGYHLGKKSMGWKFLWNPNIWIKDFGPYNSDIKQWESKPELIQTFELSKKGIANWLTEMTSKGSIIVSEYYNEEHPNEEVFTVDEFLEMAFRDEGDTSETCGDTRYPVSAEWNKKFGQYGFAAKSDCYSDFIRDGLRFATFTEFS